MKLGRVVELFKENAKYFQCPICQEQMTVTESGSIVCTNNHCFDLSSKGYVNFLTSGINKNNKYDRKLFEERAKVFESGFYGRILDEIKDIVDKHFASHAEDDYNILDAGCGEGYYASKISSSNLKYNVFALDNVKEAITLAPKSVPGTKWIVSDLTNIPFKNQSIDIILNILAPANYMEFKRLLKKGGLLIKIIPGNSYLEELRECVSEQLINKKYDNNATYEHFSNNMKIFDIRNIKYTLPISEDILNSFLHMTPMTFNVDLNSINTGGINTITIDLQIMSGYHPDDLCSLL